MSLMDEVLKNKEELVVKFLDVLAGKQASARINLDGLHFDMGSLKVKLNGNVEVTLMPQKKK